MLTSKSRATDKTKKEYLLMNKIMKQLSSHLSILVLLPCALLTGVMTYDIYHSYNRMQNSYDTEYNAFMAHEILTVVHEVQKERGTTAGFLSSQGKKFASQLKSQRQTLDKAYQELDVVMLIVK